MWGNLRYAVDGYQLFRKKPNYSSLNLEEGRGGGSVRPSSVSDAFQ